MRALIAVIVLSAALAGCNDAPPSGNPQMGPPEVTVSPPVQREIVEWDEYTGRFDAIESVEVRARVSGYLTEIHFTDGEIVQEGQPLFVIDPRPYQVALDQAEAELKQAISRQDFAARDLERAEPLIRRGNISEQAFEERLRAKREADATVEALQAAVRQARLNLEFTRVTSPVAGRISRRLVSIGNVVNGGTADATLLTTIVSLDPIYFYFDADEASYLKYMRLSQSGLRPSSRQVRNPVQLALADENGFKHEGYMDFVDNRIDSGTGTIRGRAVFPNPDLLFTPGLFARVRLVGSSRYAALLLPDEAINTDQSRKFVYTVDDEGTVQYKPVTLGPMSNGLRVIRNGITADDLVIVNGVQRARTGTKVTPVRGNIQKDGPLAVKR